MNPDQFWNKASDIYNLYHDKYRRAILTDKEMRETATAFLTGIEGLTGEWYGVEGSKNSREGNKQ